MLPIQCVFLSYHREGLAMRPGLGRVLARLDEPEGEEPRVSRLGSNSSISSTSSCSSTSWSRMHLTEYWPNTQSYKKRETCEKRCLERRDPFNKRKSGAAGFSASIPFCFPFYLPAAAPAYEMQPPGEPDSTSTRLQPVSISVLPANHKQGKGYNSVK